MDGRSVGIISSTMPRGPRGNCDEDQHRRLQEGVNRAKDNIKGHCRGLKPSEIFERATRYYAWTAEGRARTEINAICFQGGDATHRDRAQQAFERASECF